MNFKNFKKKFKNLSDKKSLIIILLAFLLVFQFISLNKNFTSLNIQGKSTSSSLIEEIGQLKETHLRLGEDLNEVRSFLMLPTKNYQSIFEIGDDVSEDENQNELQLALFQYIDYLSNQKELEQKINKNIDLLYGLFNSEDFREFLAEKELTFTKIGSNENREWFSVNSEETGNIITYFLEKEDGELYLKTNKELSKINFANVSEIITEAKEFIKENFENLQNHNLKLEDKIAEINNIINTEKIQEVINNFEIKLTDSYEEDLKIYFSILNKEDEKIGEIILDISSLEIKLQDTKNPDLLTKPSNLETALIPFLEKLDTKTFLEKHIEESKKSLEKSLEDQGFQLLLRENNLEISSTPRQKNQRLFYDIFDKNENHISSIAFELTTGVVNIVRPDGTGAENLLFFDPNFKKKT